MWLINSQAGVEVYGIYTLIIASTTVITKFVSARTGEAIIKFFVEATVNGDEEKKKQTIVYSFLIDLICSMSVTFIIYIFRDQLSNYVSKGQDISNCVLLYSVVVACSFLKSTPLGYFQATSKFNVVNFFNVLDVIVKVGLLSQYAYYQTLDIDSIILSAVLSSIISVLILMIIFIKEVRNIIFSNNKLYNPNFVNAYMKYTLTTFSSSTLKGINQGGDVLILGFFTSPLIVGLYESLKKIANIVTFISIPFPFLYSPRLSKLFVQREFRVVHQELRKITKLMITTSLILSLLIYASRDYIFELITIPDQKVEFVLLLLVSVLNNTMWWGRIYSNIVDPMISLRINIVISFFMTTVVLSSTYLYSIVGTASSMLIMNVFILSLYISSLMRRLPK